MNRPITRARPVCRRCHQRAALACVRGKWRVVPHHDVCRQCWRSLMDAHRAARLVTRGAYTASRSSRSSDAQSPRGGVSLRYPTLAPAREEIVSPRTISIRKTRPYPTEVLGSFERDARSA
jgi:hypothetical protein